MKNRVLIKKFQLELDRWMAEESCGLQDVAWLCDCTYRTVRAWRDGDNLPNRNHAVILAHFSPKLRSVFETIADVPGAVRRRNALYDVEVAA